MNDEKGVGVAAEGVAALLHDAVAISATSTPTTATDRRASWLNRGTPRP